MLVGSLFSGVGGFELGFEAAGFRTAWQCEIDNDAVSVLERHWPNVTRYRDVREIDPAQLAPVDVVVFGSPCQGFSVAGHGEGLEDERSGLFREAVRIIKGVRPTLAIWENVPGAFSANDGRDFGAVLAALADIGAVDISWRVLDAQWFGVPQRRRRIFLVADFGGERAASILFESEGVHGDSQAGRETRQDAARDAENGARSGGEPICIKGAAIGRSPENGPQYGEVLTDGTCYTLNTVEQHAIVQSGEAVAHCLTTSNQRIDAESETFVIAGRQYQQPGTDARSVLAAGTGGPGSQDWQAHAAVVTHVTAFTNRGHVAEDSAHETLHAASHGAIPMASQGMSVRRLTPRECERLMGWPDDHTRYRADRREISDGPRYRMCGNGVASPVAEWVARRAYAALGAV